MALPPGWIGLYEAMLHPTEDEAHTTCADCAGPITDAVPWVETGVGPLHTACYDPPGPGEGEES